MPAAMVARNYKDGMEIIISNLSPKNPFLKGFKRLKSQMVNHSIITDYCLDIIESLKPHIVPNFKNDPNRGPHEDFDITRLKQVILNLCSNGIKYNKPNGSVTIWASQFDSNTTRITVKYTGQGFKEGHMAKHYGPFNWLGAEHTKVQGTGIGLTITKNLVEHMNGKLSFASQLGAGSDFYVDMPVE